VKRVNGIEYFKGGSMNHDTFWPFLDTFIDAWKQSSIMSMEKFISNDYQAPGRSPAVT
jgi:hypothetical protein